MQRGSGLRRASVDPFSPLALSLIYGISDVCRNTRTGAELTRAASRTGFLGQSTRPVATGDCAANVSAARARPNPRHCEPLEAALLSHALRPPRAQTPPPTPPRRPAAPSDCCRAFARRPASYRRTADAAGNARSARAGNVTRSARASNVCSSRTRRAFPARRPRHPPPPPRRPTAWSGCCGAFTRRPAGHCRTAGAARIPNLMLTPDTRRSCARC